jgi:hypothetical protein
MAHPPNRPARDQPATVWALLWLGAIGAAAWLPLLLADGEPRGRLPARFPAASAPFQPAPLTSRPLPLDPPASLVSTGPAARGGSRWAMDVSAPPSDTPVSSPTVVTTAVAPAALLPQPARGALLLGGPLGLESLNEKPMVPAARLEQALRASAADRLAAVPPLWRPAMETLLQGPDHVLPAEIVRLPAAHVTTPEHYPLVMKADGIGETTVTPPNRSKDTLERWARKAPLPPNGSAKPLLVVLEPLPPDEPAANTPELLPAPSSEPDVPGSAAPIP